MDTNIPKRYQYAHRGIEPTTAKMIIKIGKLYPNMWTNIMCLIHALGFKKIAIPAK